MCGGKDGPAPAPSAYRMAGSCCRWGASVLVCGADKLLNLLGWQVGCQCKPRLARWREGDCPKVCCTVSGSIGFFNDVTRNPAHVVCTTITDKPACSNFPGLCTCFFVYVKSFHPPALAGDYCGVTLQLSVSVFGQSSGLDSCGMWCWSPGRHAADEVSQSSMRWLVVRAVALQMVSGYCHLQPCEMFCTVRGRHPPDHDERQPRDGGHVLGSGTAFASCYTLF